MKKYSAMAATVEDHDYPKRVAHKLGLSEDVVLALESHVDQYADMKVLSELRRSDRSFGAFGGMGFEPGAGAAALSGSIPAKILHYILTYLFRKKVDHLVAKAFLDLFMLDEETGEYEFSIMTDGRTDEIISNIQYRKIIRNRFDAA